MEKRQILFTLFIFSLLAHPAVASETLKDAIKDSKVYGDFRIRYEFVDQKGPATVTENAHASTLRSRLGVKTGEYAGVSAVIEGEHVTYIGPDNYNDTVNRRTNYPTVADPENFHVNQAYGQITAMPDTTIRAGRQVIAIDNQRFIGHVGWRQNNQVFDAAMITNKSITDTILQYGFIYNVNRIFGEQSTAGDWGSKSHFYHITNETLPIGKIITYGYLLDFGSDSTANSNQTYGLSVSGEKTLKNDVTLKYYGEYAYQSNYKDNTTSYDAHYYHIAPSANWNNFTVTLGFESLGSDQGAFAFRTPLATGHKFNGWSDRFLTTPANGLHDRYIDLTYKFANVEGKLDFLNDMFIQGQFHDFSSEDGDDEYGTEWDLFIKKPINEYITASVKYANYQANNFSQDTQKLIFDIGIKF